MPFTFVDSNVLIAAAIAGDADHDRGRAIVEGVDARDLPTARISNYVIAEVLNYVHARDRHERALDFYERLSRSVGFEVVQATKEDYLDALDGFGRHDQLSFVDATIVAFMRRTELSYLYSFDDDFDGVPGITRLTVPENPYD